MAIFHLSANIISRGKGRSAVAAAAYRSGSRITNEYDGVVHDYRRKRGVINKYFFLIMYLENIMTGLHCGTR